ncbi:MAG: AEC family transporter [Abditibacteriota bacterium]|nr:AEC family transporter [Abditibacteriota bacterium]
MFDTVYSIVLMVLLGYFTKLLGIFRDSDSGIVNNVILYVCLPCFIAHFVMNCTLDREMFMTPLVAIAMELILIFLSLGVCRLLKLGPAMTISVVMTACFANTGFVGYPVIASFFKDPKAIPTAVIIDQFGMSVLMLCTAPVLMRALHREGGGFSPRDLMVFFRRPAIPVFLLCLILHGLPLPGFLDSTLETVGKAVVPLSMLSIGLNLNIDRKLLLEMKPLAVVIVFKFIFSPLLVYAGVRMLGLSQLISNVSVLQLGLSSAVIAGIMACDNGGDKAFASQAVCVTTLFNVVYIPVCVYLLGIV